MKTLICFGILQIHRIFCSFNKSYESDEERAFRFSVFVENVQDFEEEERKHPGLDLDVTQFADWTEEEMIQVHTKRPSNTSKFRAKSNTRRDRDALPFLRQCGSCWAFATVASIEAANAIKTGQLTRLSEQEMVDCDTQNNGCQGGYRPYAMRWVLSEITKITARSEHERVFIQSYRMLSSNEEVIADWIAANGPFRPFFQQHSLGSHALTFVGYGTENGQPYWLVKNSWGSRWGQSGYFKLVRGQNACGAANAVVSPIMGK
ncbi:unnamed protein product [Haemonchus placei]|uniref:Pept_C1 domain-containing protein n=1 Tax=Haemonchus placei TaxID=6290 RepID=A0A0N4WXV7_HAEPC|nr:unnamed protein product [Haemonchus placei]